MVITDPKVIKYIESFEALKALNPLPDTELSGKDQAFLYTLTEMFNADEAFRLYISLLFHDFSKKRMALKGKELKEALIAIITFALRLNKRD